MGEGVVRDFCFFYSPNGRIYGVLMAGQVKRHYVWGYGTDKAHIWMISKASKPFLCQTGGNMGAGH